MMMKVVGFSELVQSQYVVRVGLRKFLRHKVCLVAQRDFIYDANVLCRNFSSKLFLYFV